MTKELANTQEKTEITKVTPNAVNLPALERMMNKFLSPFIQQAEQNNQLMLIIRQMLEQNANNNEAAPIEVLNNNMRYPSIDIPEISFSKVKEIQPLMQKAVGAGRRADLVHTMIIFLHTLHHLNGKAYAEQMFGLMGMPTPSGYRMLGQLRTARVIKMYRSEMIMTDMGRRIYDCTITEQEIWDIQRA